MKSNNKLEQKKKFQQDKNKNNSKWLKIVKNLKTNKVRKLKNKRSHKKQFNNSRRNIFNKSKKKLDKNQKKKRRKKIKNLIINHQKDYRTEEIKR